MGCGVSEASAFYGSGLGNLKRIQCEIWYVGVKGLACRICGKALLGPGFPASANMSESGCGPKP